MKNFLGTWLAMFVVSFVFLFFGGAMIFQNIYAAVALVSFVLAVIISVFSELQEQIDELTKKVKELEEKEGK